MWLTLVISMNTQEFKIYIQINFQINTFYFLYKYTYHTLNGKYEAFQDRYEISFEKVTSKFIMHAC